jgi:ketosteroid isomerase-like protein
MKKLGVFLFIFLASQAICFGQDSQKIQKISKDELQVRAVVQQWAAAVAARDTVAPEKLFADDLFITAHDGSTRGKKEELETLRASPGLKMLSVENEDLRIKVYGKSAVVTAIVKMRFESGGKETSVAFRYTAVFVKKNGRYQLEVLQTTRIAAPQPNVAANSGTDQ